MRTFETYQPATIKPNSINTPQVFNGFCLIHRYKVTVEKIEESPTVLRERLQSLWNRKSELKITHESNMKAMLNEAKKLGLKL